MTFPAHLSRPLFVPPGIPVVRTGPTTRAEFERLLVDDELELSAIRPRQRARARLRGLRQVVADVLQLMPRALRFERSFESR